LSVFDVAVIGGGLAGKSTAIHLLKKGYSTLILEISNPNKSIPCAGGMAASVENYFPLDLENAIETKINRVYFSWKNKDPVIAELSGKSPFLIINRNNLDEILTKEAYRFGATILFSIKVASLKLVNNNWLIQCKNKKNFRAKYLVIADGSESLWASYLNLGPKKPKYANTIAINIKGLGNIEKNTVRFEFGSIKYGFAWAFPMKDSINIGLGSFKGDSKIKDKELCEYIVQSLGFKDIKYERIFKRLRIWNGFHKLHNQRVLVVGDAASLCDPFLAEGIRPSLISSYYASETIDKCLTSNKNYLHEYSLLMKENWSKSMIWGKRIAEVFYRFPKIGYNLGVKRKTAPERIAQILSGEMNYSDIAGRVIRRFIFQSESKNVE